MIQQVIIADSGEELDQLPADQVHRASAIIVREARGDFLPLWRVVKARWSDAARGGIFQSRHAALRAVIR